MDKQSISPNIQNQSNNQQINLQTSQSNILRNSSIFQRCKRNVVNILWFDSGLDRKENMVNEKEILKKLDEISSSSSSEIYLKKYGDIDDFEEEALKGVTYSIILSSGKL